MTLEELSVLCRAAGVEVPEQDLAPLAEALANHLAGMERLRALDAADVPGEFDPRWT